ncbi:unnamed protein product [Adineta steineri]|uniref:G-protein coupled receptors family 1 profile domain-containing protein n=1 Tax=Adineta steineri TaxID=433720 RepID=A0A814YT06_9BILA|nr:unnamed protein product [Adineta steineri]CAF3682576.1 unnamed protein product [Adineta steineri]
MYSNQNDSHEPNTFWTRNFQSHTSLIFSCIIFFIYTIIFLIGLIANIFVIVMIIKRRRMRTLTNRFLLNLAISDLIATVVCLPPTAYHYYDKRWIFGEFLCRFVPFMQGTSVAVSIFTLMAVSIDRFIAIHKPIHSKLLCTPSRILITIGMTWIASFFLMIPLSLHHRIVDPFDITLTACAEEWHRNMNARLAYDFLLLFVLFILPLTLMTYCYIRISFSLWFIDGNVRSSLSTTLLNAARFSTISEDIINDVRRNSIQKPRSIYMHYHKTNDNCRNRQNLEDYRSFLISNRQQRNTILQDQNNYRQSSTIMLRRYSENDYTLNTNQIQLHIQGRPIPTRQRHSISQYTSGLIRSSVSSIPSQNNRLSIFNTQQRRSIIDFEHASRFIHSRRRVVKLLITLVIVFFITRLPIHILSIYIDITSNTYLPENTYKNTTKSEFLDDSIDIYSSYVTNTDNKMFLVLYVNPIFQLFSLSNSAINPLCYCFMSHAVKQIVTLFQQKLRRNQKKASSLTLVQ